MGPLSSAHRHWRQRMDVSVSCSPQPHANQGRFISACGTDANASGQNQRFWRNRLADRCVRGKPEMALSRRLALALVLHSRLSRELSRAEDSYPTRPDPADRRVCRRLERRCCGAHCRQQARRHSRQAGDRREPARRQQHARDRLTSRAPPRTATRCCSRQSRRRSTRR